MLLKNFIFKLALLCICCVLAITCPAEARDIYVRLSTASSFKISSDGAMTLTDAKGAKTGLDKSATLSLNKGKAVVGKKSFVLPVRVTAAGLLRFNNRSYRGALLLTNKGLLNVLDLEQYLCGVLPAESGSDWPTEALRAQAIISRTYALRQSLNRKSRGYDVVDTVSDQVYKGAGVETAKTNQAVSSTAGEIIAYGKELAFTPFHSDSGGHTASNEHVWGTIVPYLTGVPEPVEYTSPNSSWAAKISRSNIEKALAKSSSGVGAVKEIRVSEVDKAGRAVNLTFIGAKGSKMVKASTFRLNVGANLLKSTMLVPNTGTTPVLKAMSPVKINNSNNGFAIPRNGDDFVFYGRGWGHGVGLSQWGSLAMAKAGWKAEKILTYYYPGTEIKRFK